MLNFSLLPIMGLLVPLMLSATPQYDLVLYAPEDSHSQLGDTSAAGPFWPGQGRYQQVFIASDFLPAVTNGLWCNFFAFRSKVPGTLWSVENQVEVRLSTTKRGPDELSPVFAENVGTNETLVLSGRMMVEAGCGSTSPCFIFDYGVYFNRHFYYDPREGNLLFDYRVVVPHLPTNGLHGLDAWDRTNDTVSSVYSASVTSPTGVVQTIGFATQIEGYLTPHLEVQASPTNQIVLSWVRWPDAFVLERSSSLEPQAIWNTVTEGVILSPSGLIRSLTIPWSSVEALQYYRLVCPTRSPPTQP